MTVQDGKPLVSGVITAEEQEAALTGGKPDDKPVPLTPNQARQRDRDEWPDSVGAPGYERKRVVVRTDAEVAKAERVEFAEPTTRERGARVAEQLREEYRRLEDAVGAQLVKEGQSDNARRTREAAGEAEQIRREVSEARSQLEAIRRRTGV